ncbi:MAG: Fic family protein [Candidatus Accumulibacter sp.]|jgi:Fic family protein|nr:Fic family protein [Accumulibacter sp.]
MSDSIGYRRLADRYGVSAVQAFRTDSAIAKKRASEYENGYVHEYYLPESRPADTLAGHLGFALKHEGVHLEFLSRLFEAIPAAELETWVAAEPTGRYARRAGFFYETLTGRRLNFPGVRAGNYVTAIDGDAYLTAPHPLKDTRWRVRDNLPGSRRYCPTVLRTDRVRDAEAYDCARRLAELELEFGADILQRGAVWLSVKESRASFAIEREDRHADRVQRFAAAIERYCGRFDDPLSESALSELQARILGPKATRLGLRRSPVFVGEADAMTEVVHYIAPHWDDAPSLLSGLRDCARRTVGGSSLARAAFLSFGFVYIHPMSDGNGRISRFLVNDVLRRDGAVPEPFIVPVSASITRSASRRRAYDRALERFSRPFMHKYADAWSFGPEQVGDDGVHFNFRFDAYQDALHAWRYPDMTDHVEYLAEIVRVTLEEEMRDEAAYLRDHRLARERVKRVIECPDGEIDRIIRSVRENGGKISNKLRKETPALADERVAEEVVAAIRSVLPFRAGG